MSFLIVFLTLILPKTLLVCSGEKAFLVIFTLLLLKQFDLVQIQKNNNFIFKKENLLKLILIILIPTLTHDILTYIGSYLFPISIIICSILIITLISIFYKIKGIKNIFKLILCYICGLLVLTILQLPYLFINIENTLMLSMNVFSWKLFLFTLPERLVEIGIIGIVLIKTFNLLKTNLINPIINNKKALFTIVVSAILNILLLLFLIFRMMTFSNQIAISTFISMGLPILIVSLVIFNFISIGTIIYTLMNQKLYDKISVKDRVYLLNKFVSEMSNAIESVFDFKEFLKNINHTIIKTMNIDYSTIIFLDNETNKLRIELTNLENNRGLEIITANLNCRTLLNVLLDNRPIIDNAIVEEEIVKKYPFTSNRNIGSLICVPIYNKAQKGLILIEDECTNSFDEQSMKLLSIIGQQLSMALDNIQLYKKNKELMDLDYLTGVYNRHKFQKILNDEFSKSKQQNKNLSLIMLDIDHFKNINDTYGHLFGDEVLKHVSNVIKNNIRKEDIISRYGGEEFVIILPETNLNIAYEITERLREKVEESEILNKNKNEVIHITSSFGISTFPDNSFSEIELMYNADKALYEAKNSGRNCVRTFEQIKK